MSSDLDPSLLMVGVICFVASIFGSLYVLQRLFPKVEKYPKVLPLADFQPFPLIRKEMISHDTGRYTFGLPKGYIMGLPTGQHIVLKYTNSETGKPVQRSYTPVSDNTVVGEITFVIKVYKPAPPKFPHGGLLSQHVDSLKIGDTILMRGPKGHLEWLGQGAGKLTVKPLGKPLEKRSCQQLGLLAGGTGVTPMLQILNAVFRHPGDTSVNVKMIYANQTVDDILVRDELEQLQKDFPDRFQLWYTVDRVIDENRDSWKYSVGFIDKEMVKQHLLFDNKKETQFFICGPPPMVKFACLPHLQAFGYSEKDWVIF